MEEEEEVKEARFLKPVLDRFYVRYLGVKAVLVN
jgi:hypothetical protein